jgi:hypothetical protein
LEVTGIDHPVDAQNFRHLIGLNWGE